uniref:Uncharacterized protein n=1 Tax=Strigamia maritima TaxID=126957 RepID=T1ILS2_STRMM
MEKYLSLFLLTVINYYISCQSSERLQHGLNAHRVFITSTHHANGYANNTDGHNRRMFEQQIVVNRSFPLQYQTSTSSYETIGRVDPVTTHKFNDTWRDGSLEQQLGDKQYQNQQKEHESTSTSPNNIQYNYGYSSDTNFQNNGNEDNNQQASNEYDGGNLLPRHFHNDHYQDSGSSGYFSQPQQETFHIRYNSYHDNPYDRDMIAENDGEDHTSYQSKYYYTHNDDNAEIESEQLFHVPRYSTELPPIPFRNEKPLLFSSTFNNYPDEYRSYYFDAERSESRSRESQYEVQLREQEHEDEPFYPPPYWTTDDDYYQ